MFSEKQLEAYLHENIPITYAMGVKVKRLSLNEVILSASFANNINHKKTAFGGSLHAVATLACWSLLFVNLLDEPGAFDIVIANSTVDYLAPVISDLESHCAMPDDAHWTLFKKTLKVKGKARIVLSASIFQDGKLAVAYKGTFAAISKVQ